VRPTRALIINDLGPRAPTPTPLPPALAFPPAPGIFLLPPADRRSWYATRGQGPAALLPAFPQLRNYCRARQLRAAAVLLGPGLLIGTRGGQGGLPPPSPSLFNSVHYLRAVRFQLGGAGRGWDACAEASRTRKGLWSSFLPSFLPSFLLEESKLDDKLTDIISI
jgi:hypothetical protein